MDTTVNQAVMDDAVAHRWIVANVMVLVIGAVCAFAGTGADALFGIESADLTTAAKMAYWTIQIGLVVVPCAAYGMLTAPVLQSIIPALRADLWFAVHVAMGVVVGGGLASPLFAEGTKLVSEGILQGVLVVGGIVGMFIMVPALRRLQPRG